MRSKNARARRTKTHTNVCSLVFAVATTERLCLLFHKNGIISSRIPLLFTRCAACERIQNVRCLCFVSVNSIERIN